MKTRLAEKSSSRGCGPQSVGHSLKSGEGIKVEKTVTINRPPEVLYAFWRDFENLPRFMQHLEAVRELDACTSHWVMRTSHGKRLEWDARIVEEKPDQMIAWQSLPGSELENAGSVWFTPAPAGRGTTVKVALKYSPPGGKLAATLAKIFGEDGATELEQDLLRFKALMEAGEMPTTEGQPAGDRS